MRNVEHDAIGVAELALEIHPATAFQFAMKVSAIGLDPSAARLQVIDNKSHVVQADEVLATLIASGIFGMEFEQCEIYRAVGQRQTIPIRRDRQVDPLHSEGVDIELGGSLDIGHRQGNVTQFCHGTDLLGSPPL